MRRFFLFTVGLLVPIVIVELGVRCLGPSLPDPRPWPSLESEIKASQMGSLARDVDVVVVGTSVSEAAINPQLFLAATGRYLYNASLPFGSPPALETWIESFVIPLAAPDVVVVGLLPAGLGLGPAQDPLKRGLDQVVEVSGGSHRLSELLRRRGQIKRVLDIVRESRTPPTLWTEDGHQTAYYEVASPAISAASELILDTDPDYEPLAAVGRIVRMLNHHGILAVILIEPGGCPPALAECPAAATVEAAVFRVQELAEELAVPLIDGRRLVVPPDGYADSSHFNRSGTEAFSRFFAGEFARVVP